MNRDLFLAILSMDSYNRGYGQGLQGLDAVIGQTRIGNAVISNQVDIGRNSAAVAAGFYALAYRVSGVTGIADGSTVIAYRGTDTGSIFDTFVDIGAGWGLGGGFPGSQAALAIEFYQSVARSQGVTANWRDANITTTGHSLGGGLAGLAANDNDNAFCENLGARSRAA